jgi:hypothetical protein
MCKAIFAWHMPNKVTASCIDTNWTSVVWQVIGILFNLIQLLLVAHIHRLQVVMMVLLIRGSSRRHLATDQLWLYSCSDLWRLDIKGCDIRSSEIFLRGISFTLTALLLSSGSSSGITAPVFWRFLRWLWRCRMFSVVLGNISLLRRRQWQGTCLRWAFSALAVAVRRSNPAL